MINLVEHTEHTIQFKLNSGNLDVYCYTCHDTHAATKIGSFLLEKESA